MARGYIDSSIIGGPLDPDVLTQLQRRESLYKSKSNRSSKELLYLNGKTGWVKLSSSVNINGDEKAAQDNILFGGAFSERNGQRNGLNFKGTDNTSAYNNFANSTGFRPMPGITGFRIDSKNRFGTLREAVVDFQVWSVEQLTQYESLYLRPGFTVLLEWGHTIYLDNTGTGDSRVKTTPPSVSNYFNNTVSKEKVIEQIRKKKKDSSQNYDGVFGYIKNFLWSYRTDGGYDCKLTIISAGELIESVQAAINPNTTGDNPEIKEDPEKAKTNIHNFLITVRDTENESNINDNLEKNAKDLFDRFKKETNQDSIDVLRVGLAGATDEEEDKSKFRIRYIRIRDLLGLCNVGIVPRDQNDSPLFSLNTDETKSIFSTFPDHIALDPKIAVLPKISQSNLSLLKYKMSDQDQGAIVRNGDDTSILNIFVNIDYILNVLNSLTLQSTTDSTLTNFIEGVLRGVQNTLGDINEFGIHYEEEEFKQYIVDRRLTPNKNNLSESILNLTGLKSTVTNVSLTSKLSPNIASMIAISAQASNTDVGQDVENMFRWNQGLEDRVVTERNVRVKESLEAKRKKILNNLILLSREVSIFNTTKSYNGETIKSLATAHREIMQYLSRLYNNADIKAGASGIIPFDLDITLDGIGGVKIGQAFQITPGLLPKKYDGVVGFIITGVGHVVSNNKWNTELKGQTIIIGKPAEQSNYQTDDVLSSEALQAALLENREIGDPNIPFKIIDNEKISGVAAFPSTFGKEISLDTLLSRLNSDTRIQNAFRGFFEELIRDYKQYKVLINTTFRSLKRSYELKYDKSETYYNPNNAEPGSSSHNYAAALDMNLQLPSGVILNKKGDTPLWEVSQVPAIALGYNIEWGGGYRGNQDAVHFGFSGINYKELGKRQLEELGFQSEESSDFPLTVTAPDGREAPNWLQFLTFKNLTSPSLLKSEKIFEQLNFSGSESKQDILKRLRDKGVDI